MQVTTFGVIGRRQMGGGIAQVAAASGLNVILHDIADEFVAKGMKVITANLQRSVDKGKLSTDEMEAILGRIRTVTDLAAMKDADIVVEAASQAAVREVAVAALMNSRNVMIMSVGALSDKQLLEELRALAKEHHCHIHVPSGAIGRAGRGKVRLHQAHRLRHHHDAEAGERPERRAVRRKE